MHQYQPASLAPAPVQEPLRIEPEAGLSNQATLAALGISPSPTTPPSSWLGEPELYGVPSFLGGLAASS